MEYVEKIEIENFKSYKGYTSIGPIIQFSVISGSRGSGKSNLVDAICFVLGEDESNFGVPELNHLIHGGHIGSRISDSASVSITFVSSYDEYMKFERLIENNELFYKIDGEVVSRDGYLERLKSNYKIDGINKNFLIRSKDLDDIAAMTGIQLMQHFEKWSGSLSRKEWYEELKLQIMNQRERVNDIKEDAKKIKVEQRTARKNNEEAEKYQALKKELTEGTLQLYLFRLFCNEDETLTLKEMVDTEESDYYSLKFDEKRKLDEKCQFNKSEKNELCEDLESIEKEILETEMELNDKMPELIYVQENIRYWEKKISRAKKSLEDAEKIDEERTKELRDLEKELERVEALGMAYEDEVGESQVQDEVKLNEYDSLNNVALKQVGHLSSELDSIVRIQEEEQDLLDFEKIRLMEMDSKLKDKLFLNSEMQNKLDTLLVSIREKERLLEEKNEYYHSVKLEAKESKENVAIYQKELRGIARLLVEAKFAIETSEERCKRERLVTELRCYYPGVVNRVKDLYESNDNYDEVTRSVFNRYLEAIIVDTESTAQLCVKYLKDHFLHPEIFIPLDNIHFRPVKAGLRNIKRPTNVKLLYDVVSFDEGLHPALLFLTDNTLICDITDEAIYVAYNISLKNSYNAISMDGTYCRKSGVLTIGLLDEIEEEEERDDVKVLLLKSEKEKFNKHLKNAMKQSNKEIELYPLKLERNEITFTLHNLRSTFNTEFPAFMNLEGEVQSLSDDVDIMKIKIEKMENSLLNRDEEITRIKARINRIRENVFSDFIERYNYAYIEECDDEFTTRGFQEKATRLLDNEFKKNDILNRLDFLRANDTSSEVTDLENSIWDYEEELFNAKELEIHASTEVDYIRGKLEIIKTMYKTKETEIDSMDGKMELLSIDNAVICKNMRVCERAIEIFERRIAMLVTNRYLLLKHCVINGIQIKVDGGDLTDVIFYSGSGNFMDTYPMPELGIDINYSEMMEQLRDLEDPDERDEIEFKIENDVTKIEVMLGKIDSPDLLAARKLRQLQEKLVTTHEELNRAKVELTRITEDFVITKSERFIIFMQFFDFVTHRVNYIYKKLVKVHGAHAKLGLENENEPYLGGLNLFFTTFDTRFQPLSYLPDSERRIAALALQIAILNYRQSPFLLLDEVDSNIGDEHLWKLASYFMREQSFQFIGISEKEKFYSQAETLFKIVAYRFDCLISKIRGLQLSRYLDMED